jgi:hypothetical protein
MATYEDLKANLNGMDPFDAPIPGESLTADPAMKAPYEQPPQFTSKDEAVEEIFMRMTDEEVIDEFLDLMRMGTPVEYIAQVVLFEGFRTGKFNPDLMLLLIEPVIYILLYLADYGGIDNVVLYPEDDMGMGQLSVLPTGAIQVGDQEVAQPAEVPQSLLDVITAERGAE